MITHDINEVMKRLPQRYPFLLIDRVTDCTPGESLTAIKNVTVNEPFFQGHFPGLPLMPGVLILEAMAQACGIFTMHAAGLEPGCNISFLFVGIDKARFKRQVIPGDQLVFTVSLLRRKRTFWVFDVEARVDDQLAATAEIMCAEHEMEF